MSLEQCINCKFNPKRYIIDGARFWELKSIKCFRDVKIKVSYQRSKPCPYFEEREADPAPDIPKIEEELHRLICQFNELINILNEINYS